MGKFRTYSVKEKNRQGLIHRVGYRNPFTVTAQDQHVVHQYSHSSVGQLLNPKKNQHKAQITISSDRFPMSGHICLGKTFFCIFIFAS